MSVYPIKVLLVEDDSGDSRLIQEMLRERSANGFVLDVAVTLKDGIQKATEVTYDVILLDLNLPDSVGLETLFRLRSTIPDTPIVILTGFDSSTDIGIDAVKNGAQDYLVKGDIDPKLLAHSMRYAIERHEIERRLRNSEREYRSLIDDVFNTSMVAVIILDSEFRIVWCNEATEIYFGLERENILGRDKRLLVDDELKCVFADPDDYSARLLKAYDEHSYTDRFECHVLPEGNRAERWLEHWSQPIRDGMYLNGRIEQYTDITDRKVLEFKEHEQRLFAESLSDIAATLTSTLDLDDVLGRILTNLTQIVPHDSASIMLLEDHELQVVRQKYSDNRDTQEIIAEEQLKVQYQRYLAMMSTTLSPILVNELHEDEEIREYSQRANLQAYMGAPILLQQRIIGFMNLLNEEANSFSDDSLDRLTAFARLAGIAIQNAQLYQQSRNLAALEERQRLARDLHDSVTQTMFSGRTILESAIQILDSNPTRAYNLIENVHQLLVTASNEMRILLLELRPEALTRVSLKELFEQYLRPLYTREEFSIDLQIDEIPALPSDVQMALYRIAQETLNNVRKHANASQVTVEVSKMEGRIELKTCDDGDGFDVQAVSSTSMGLSIIRERADEIGATLHLESQLGEGTCITVIWSQTS